MAKGLAGDIEASVKANGTAVKVGKKTSRREGKIRGMMAALMNVLQGSDDADEECITLQAHHRKQTPDGRPARTIIHAEHTPKRRHSVIVEYDGDGDE